MTDIDEIAVVGAGITGLTTALVLRLAGYRTVVFASRRAAMRPGTAAHPDFATLHAAASVLPHSVRGARVPSLTARSQPFFEALAFCADAGVRTQSHYEMFERAEVSPPAYASAVKGFTAIPAVGLSRHSQWPPRRPGADTVCGWRFDAFFCEAPRYLYYLERTYEALGGRFAPVQASTDIITICISRGYKLLVNCVGGQATTVLNEAVRGGVRDAPGDGFEPLADAWGMRTVRGHYLKVRAHRSMLDDHGRFASYNYTPSAEVYRRADGGAADVYCYPRSDAWILGGSRQRQDEPLNPQTGWRGEESPHPAEEFRSGAGTSIAVPRPIFDVNAAILADLTDQELDLKRLRHNHPEAITAGIGYRSERADPAESVRISCSRAMADGEKFVVHNYGHGGAGFTLSWGAAVEVLGLTARVVTAPGPKFPARDADEPVESTASLLRAVLARVTSV